MKYFIISIFTLFQLLANGQDTYKSPAKKLFIKSNVLSLLAQQPSISFEKVFTNNVSVESSFVQGKFNNLLFTDRYSYNGFLLRVKKYMKDLEFGATSPYVAMYAGNLNRRIVTEGRTDNSGWFGYPSRYFSAQSIRSGLSFGTSTFTHKKIILDGQLSMGYGRYIDIDKNDPSTYANGYLDVQLWFSVGYCF